MASMCFPSPAFILLFALFPAFNGALIVVRNDGPDQLSANSTQEKVLPECQWRGTAPFCDGDCHLDEILIGKSAYEPESQDFGARCWIGEKNYCCRWPKEAVVISMDNKPVQSSIVDRIPLDLLCGLSLALLIIGQWAKYRRLRGDKEMPKPPTYIV